VFEKKKSVGGLWSVKPPDQPNHDGPRSGDNDKAHPATQSSPGFVSPSMLTNLSRFTVSFSDLAWESVDLNQNVPTSKTEGSRSASPSPPPLFPKAWQVGRYLETYAERYLPSDVLKLGCQVIRTERRPDKDGETGWIVEWLESAQDRYALLTD
jgi:hypothetical protein